MKKTIYILLLIVFSSNIQAHESCKDILSLTYSLYDKTISSFKQDDLKDASYHAKRFQLEAYGFSLVCKEELELDNKKHTYKRIVKQLEVREVALYNKGVLKKKILSN